MMLLLVLILLLTLTVNITDAVFAVTIANNVVVADDRAVFAVVSDVTVILVDEILVLMSLLCCRCC